MCDSDDHHVRSFSDWLRYFPFARDVDHNRLCITRVGRYSISKPEHADLTSKHIVTFARLLDVGDPRNLSITDATAGFGGNALSFLRYFKRVICVERDPQHFTVLKNNLSVYNFADGDCLRLVNADYTHIYQDVCSDIIFFDLPWNNDDVWYSKKKELMLYLSEIPLFTLVSNVFKSTSTKLVACKVPYNFNFSMFIRKISCNLIIKTAKVHTYYIILVHRSP